MCTRIVDKYLGPCAFKNVTEQNMLQSAIPSNFSANGQFTRIFLFNCTYLYFLLDSAVAWDWPVFAACANLRISLEGVFANSVEGSKEMIETDWFRLLQSAAMLRYSTKVNILFSPLSQLGENLPEWNQCAHSASLRTNENIFETLLTMLISRYLSQTAWLPVFRSESKIEVLSW